MKFLKESINLNKELLDILHNKHITFRDMEDYKYQIEIASILNLDYNKVKEALIKAEYPDDFSKAIYEISDKEKYNKLFGEE